MKKKVLMGLVLLAIIGTSSVFAQKVGDSVQLSGKTYRVESVSNGRVVLQLVPSLDGTWVDQMGWKYTFKGNTATISYIKPDTGNDRTRDAVNKGYYKVGTQQYRNLKSAGNLTWSGQAIGTDGNTSRPGVATGTSYRDVTITMSQDGQTLTDSYGRVLTRE